MAHSSAVVDWRGIASRHTLVLSSMVNRNVYPHIIEEEDQPDLRAYERISSYRNQYLFDGRLDTGLNLAPLAILTGLRP